MLRYPRRTGRGREDPAAGWTRDALSLSHAQATGVRLATLVETDMVKRTVSMWWEKAVMSNKMCGSRVPGTDDWVSNNARKSTDVRHYTNAVDHPQALAQINCSNAKIRRLHLFTRKCASHNSSLHRSTSIRRLGASSIEGRTTRFLGQGSRWST